MLLRELVGGEGAGVLRDEILLRRMKVDRATIIRLPVVIDGDFFSCINLPESDKFDRIRRFPSVEGVGMVGVVVERTIPQSDGDIFIVLVPLVHIPRKAARTTSHVRFIEYLLSRDEQNRDSFENSALTDQACGKNPSSAKSFARITSDFDEFRLFEHIH